MRRPLLRLLAAAVLAAVISTVVLTFEPAWEALVLEIDLLLLAAVGVVALVSAIGKMFPRRPSHFEAAVRPRPVRHERLPELVRLEDLVRLAAATSFDEHYRLRPILRTAATSLLASRGIDLDSEPERARSLIGERAWDVVRPERTPPGDREGVGPGLGSLSAVVAGLEEAAGPC